MTPPQTNIPKKKKKKALLIEFTFSYHKDSRYAAVDKSGTCFQHIRHQTAPLTIVTHYLALFFLIFSSLLSFCHSVCLSLPRHPRPPPCRLSSAARTSLCASISMKGWAMGTKSFSGVWCPPLRAATNHENLPGSSSCASACVLGVGHDRRQCHGKHSGLQIHSPLSSQTQARLSLHKSRLQHEFATCFSASGHMKFHWNESVSVTFVLGEISLRQMSRFAFKI